MEIFLVGGDARSRWVADYFRREGVLFSSCGIDTDAPLPPQFSCLVLPFPAQAYSPRARNAHIRMSILIFALFFFMEIRFLSVNSTVVLIKSVFSFSFCGGSM